MRRIAIIPVLCTLCNAACGFGSILFAAHVSIAANLPESLNFYISGWLIFAAMVFDMFDGYLARRVKSTSQFGAELDSLCDAVSFGVAPAFLLIQLGEAFEGRLARDAFLVVATLYMVCVILRLARFNVQSSLDPKSHRKFSGLPSPAAAGCIASLVVLRFNLIDPRGVSDAVLNPLIEAAAPLGAIAVALLMISRVPYVHLGVRVLRRRQSFARLVQLIVAVLALVLFRELALVVMFWLYALAGPAYYLWTRSPWSVREEASDQDATTAEQH